MRMLKWFAVAASLLLGAPAYGQDVHIMWKCGTTGFAAFCQVEAANPLPVTGTFTPAGTQNVNITQILGAAPSLTNPLWVSPATGATFPVSGTVAATQSGTWTVQPGNTANTTAWLVTGTGGTFPVTGTVAVTQSTSPWITAGGGTAGSAAIGVVTVQGIASMTPVAVSGASGSFASGAFASGSFASGSHASGSFASGAFASGSVASGALASGSLASGAMVDLVALSAPVAPATATATKSVLLGAQATTGAVNPTNGQQGALSSDTNNNLLTSPGGAPNLTIAQVSIATSDTLAIAARALRRSVTIQQVTGTQNVFCNQTTATAGNGVVLPAVVGANFTFNTTSAIRCIAITGAQTVAIAETY